MLLMVPLLIDESIRLEEAYESYLLTIFLPLTVVLLLTCEVRDPFLSLSWALNLLFCLRMVG